MKTPPLVENAVIDNNNNNSRKNMSAQATPSPPSSPEKDFFAFGEDYIKSPEHIPATIESIDFDRLLDKPLLLHQDLASGCGGMLWPAGMRLAKYLLKMKRDEMRNAESMCVPSYIEQSFMIATDFSERECKPPFVNACFFLFCSIELGAGGGLVG